MEDALQLHIRDLSSYQAVQQRPGLCRILCMLLFLGHQLVAKRNRRIGILLFFVLSLPSVMAQNPQASAQDPPTPQRPSTADDCIFGGPFLHIPSRVAGNGGLLVRVSPPEKARYPEGAPVVVHMSPRPSVSGSHACLSEQGLIDVGFLCPGAEYRQPDGTVWRSGGSVDRRQLNGLDCVGPLADVIAFATGRTRSVDGKSIQSYSGRIRALTDNVGVIGWSYGGFVSQKCN